MLERTREDKLNDARDYATMIIRTGFESRDDAIERVADSLADDLNEPELAPAIVDEAVGTLVAEQADWPAETDCDRLDRAFVKLNEAGIFARHHYSCCGTCGASEAGAEVQYAHKHGQHVRGYTFYHVQDTEDAVNGDGICLSYGDVEETDEGSVAIAEEVRAALEREGLKVTWDGDIHRRLVVDLDWKRRWPPRTPDRVPDHVFEGNG
jgi:hypothetical protein